MKNVYWIKAADKDFRKFPMAVQETMLDALAIAAEGQKADAAKPMKGLGAGVFEIALSYKTDAYRAVYAVQLG
jgi:phage-related protein